MKRFSTLAALVTVACAATLNSCQKGTETTPTDGDPVEVRFTGDLAAVQTRVGGPSGNVWDEGDPIGVYMYDAGAGTLSESSALVFNKLYTASAGTSATFAPDGGTPLYYPADGGNVKFVAYHPHSAASNIYNVPINTRDQSNQSALDVLYAAPAASYNRLSTGAVALQFRHVMSKLVFNISGDQSVDTPVAGGVTVSISGHITSGRLHLPDGSVDGSPGMPVEFAASGTGETVSAEATVIPGSTAGVELLFINNAGESFTCSLPTAHTAWEPGKRYTYTVTLRSGRVEAAITGEIDEWTDAGEFPITGVNEEDPVAGSMSLTAQTGAEEADNTVAFGLGGPGTATVDWGDGTSDTYRLGTDLTQIAHTYTDGLSSHSVGISGGGIKRASFGPTITAVTPSGNPALEVLETYGPLEVLDVYTNGALKYLHVNNSLLASINTGGNPALEIIVLSDNAQLMSLDLSGNSALESATLQGNTSLTELDLSGKTALRSLNCNGNGLQNISVAGCVLLRSIPCRDNRMDAAALNALFGSLPDYSAEAEHYAGVYIGGNPGAADCDPDIATAKHWDVRTN